MAGIKMPKADTMEIFRTTNVVDSDDEEFLALLSVAEKAENTSLIISKKLLLFQSIRPGFLQKLLKITSHDLTSQFRKFAATAVLAVFCEDPNLAAYTTMLFHIPKLIETVCQADYSSKLTKITNENAYFCLYEIAKSKFSGEIFVECQAITHLSELFLGTSLNAELALEVLRRLVVSIDNCWERTDSVLFHKVMNKIAINLGSKNEQENLDTCMILKDFMLSNNTSDWFGHLWPQIIYKEIKNTLNLEKKNAVGLVLAPIALNYLGIEWIMSSTDGNPKEFILLLVNTAVMEIQIRLENNQPNTVLENDASLIASCTMILETILIVMDLEKLKLQPLDLQPLNENLEKTAQKMIKFLMAMSSKNFARLNRSEYSCIDHFVRFLTGCLIRNTILKIDVTLPILLDVANKSFNTQRYVEMKKKARTRAEAAAIAAITCKESSSNILRKILPLLRILVADKSARQILETSKQMNVFYDCFKYYWAIIISQSTLNDEESCLLRQQNKARRAVMHIGWILYHIKCQPGYSDPPACTSIGQFILDNLVTLAEAQRDVEFTGILSLIGLTMARNIRVNNMIDNLVKLTLNYLCRIRTNNDHIKNVHLHKIWSVGIRILPWYVLKAYEHSGSASIVKLTLQLLSLITEESARARVKSAYEDFFLHLAKDTYSSDFNEAKELGLLEISRSYHMEKLTEVLNGNKE